MAKSKSTEYLKSISNQLRESSDVYSKAIPKLTQNSDINDLKNPLFTNELLYNTFYTGFTNMVAKTVFAMNTIFNNPLEILKKGNNQLGFDIREVANDLLEEHKYTLNDELLADVLKLDTPTTYQCIHRLNRQSYFKISISEAEFELAFISWDELDALFMKKAELLDNSNYVAEFEWSKALLRSAVDQDKIEIVEIDAITNESTGKAAVKQIKNAVADFKYPSVLHTGLYHMTAGVQSINVWTRPEDTVLVIPSKSMNELDTDVLAVAFNVDKLAFKVNNVLEVDELGFTYRYLASTDTTVDATKTYYTKNAETGEYEAVAEPTGNPSTSGYYEKHFYKIEFMVFDQYFTQIYDKKNQFWAMPISSAMIEQRYLHVWQTYSLSPFCNARAFMSEVSESDVPTGYEFNKNIEATNDSQPIIVNG